MPVEDCLKLSVQIKATPAYTLPVAQLAGARGRGHGVRIEIAHGWTGRAFVPRRGAVFQMIVNAGQRGAPYTFVTTTTFLAAFDIESLRDLPCLKQLDDAEITS